MIAISLDKIVVTAYEFSQRIRRRDTTAVPSEPLAIRRSCPYVSNMASEIIFEVREDEADGGYTASALGYDIFTEADSLDELRKNVRSAVQCHFGDGVPGPVPTVIRLHFVRDEVLAT